MITYNVSYAITLYRNTNMDSVDFIALNSTLWLDIRDNILIL